MNITKRSTDQAVLAELGRRLAQSRLDRNLTQAQLALQAGVSKRTVERLESGGEGEGTRLSAFIRVCRALDMLDRLEMLIPDAAPSPIAQLKFAGRQRRRASRTKTLKAGTAAWTWGDNA